MAETELGFGERAAFIAGPAKSGTTLLVALLDSHPEFARFPSGDGLFPPRS